MDNKESLFASLHILMPAIPDGPEDAGRRLHRYWYRESRCQVHTGWQIQNPFNQRNLRLMIYLRSYKAPFCAFLWLKNPRNLRNPWLTNDLRLFKALYICRESFTTVKNSLQIKPFYAKQSQFPKKSNERK
jgi:hypothetical protein